MDPNANLNEMLELAKEIADAGGRTDPEDASRLAELVLGLDGWLSGKGFLPERWEGCGDRLPVLSDAQRQFIEGLPNVSEFRTRDFGGRLRQSVKALKRNGVYKGTRDGIARLTEFGRSVLALEMDMRV